MKKSFHHAQCDIGRLLQINVDGRIETDECLITVISGCFGFSSLITWLFAKLVTSAGTKDGATAGAKGASTTSPDVTLPC